MGAGKGPRAFWTLARLFPLTKRRPARTCPAGETRAEAWGWWDVLRWQHCPGLRTAFCPQGRGRPGAPFVAFLGVQFYVENGRVIR